MNVAKDYWRCVQSMSSGKVPELFVEVRGKDENKCTWERTVEGRALMDYVLLPKRMRGTLLYVNVRREEGGGMFDHFLMEARLKGPGGWRV